MKRIDFGIYANEGDRDLLEAIDKFAKARDWSRSKAIKNVLREVFFATQQPQIEAVQTQKPEPVEEEKISPDDIFKDLEEAIEADEDKGDTQEEQAWNCTRKIKMPSGAFNCENKNVYKAIKPYCPVCWQMEEIWGDAVVRMRER